MARSSTTPVAAIQEMSGENGGQETDLCAKNKDGSSQVLSLCDWKGEEQLANPTSDGSVCDTVEQIDLGSICHQLLDALFYRMQWF